MDMLKVYLKKRMLGSAFKGTINQGPNKEKFKDSEFLLTKISYRHVWGHPVGHPDKKFCFKHADVRFYFNEQQSDPHQPFLSKLLESLCDLEEDIKSGYMGDLIRDPHNPNNENS